MKLRYLQIVIEPLWDPFTESKEIRIKLQADGEVYNFTKVLPRDDFNSLFDRIMDQAKHDLKKVITNASEESTPETIALDMFT